MKKSLFLNSLLLASLILLLTSCNPKPDSFFHKITNSFSKKQQSSTTYNAIAVWQNNNEGNWDIAYAVYRDSDNSWLSQVDKNIYYEGNANLIAKLQGDDNDPDIASTKHSAMAVWSNTGMPGNQSADIFVAKWKPSGWDQPVRLFALAGDDTDPTIYLQDPQHALVVWINKNGQTSNLYYSVYDTGYWSNPQTIDIGSVTAIATPELGYITLPVSRYLLVFAARINQQDTAYTGIYSQVNGWMITPFNTSGAAAIVDTTIPARYRMSTAMHIASHKVVASWSGRDGNLWLAQVSPADKVFKVSSLGAGNNPVVLYAPHDINGTASIIYAAADKLINMTPIGGDLKQQISTSETSPVRADATYLLSSGAHTAVAIWSTQQESPSEIYFSAVNSQDQQWTVPDRIDKKVFPGEDKNPAIAPILVHFDNANKLLDETEDEYIMVTDYCGDKILQKAAGEECEIGIACKKPAEMCDWQYNTRTYGPVAAALFSDCECGVFISDNPKLPKTTTAPEKKFVAKPATSLLYGGASCGFNQVALSSDIGTDQVKLQFLPGTNPANGVTTFTGHYPQYQKENFTLFPLSTPPQDKYFVVVSFSNNDNTITMTGIDPATNFQLCIGIFTKGAVGQKGGFVPVGASRDLDVPALPLQN